MANDDKEAPKTQDQSSSPVEPGLPCDFNTFIMSLATGAMMNLGKPGPDGSTPPVNLPLARHSIDILAMLEQKTAGNLSGSEERLLSQVLYDLRMRCAKISK